MCDLSQDGLWESDNAPDFSSLTRRIDSFRGSNLANKVPAETLAQAGFFYTGESDRVRCFSCNMTVDNWYSGDRPVDKHKQFSPSCTFLTCVHRTSFNQNSNTALISEEVGDVEYRLRTGEVVDEAPYPIVPHMRNEEARLRTFSSWPNRTPTGIEEDASNNLRANDPALMQNFEARRATFAGVRHPIDHERLARAGFYSTGRGDAVLCFHCGGGLNNWQPEEDPWVEHAKHYPGCSFLLANKGPEFVNSIQLQRPQHDRAASSHQNPVSEDMEDEDTLEKLQRLQREKQCKICMDRDIAIVFIPCAHLVACENCSQALNKCPICCQDITQKIKTYIA
uniref:E3 ubiquitin-protein ligase XIAP n=1 Tax=Maylandia zebra TaxID=106582 RepID=A0A3P9BJ68_9CICH